MTLRAFIARVLAGLERSLERSRDREAGDIARGEFISTLIIDHGTAHDTAPRRPRG